MPENGQSARWLTEARAALETVKGSPATEYVVVLVRDASGASVRFKVAVEGAGERIALALSPLERRIVEALRGGPLIGKRVAAALKQPYDSTLRIVLANLCEREPPVIESTRAGYQLVSDRVDSAV